MKLFSKKSVLGNAGFSLVELMISMAILAIVSTAIGGAMYVSSRSYTRGSSEVTVQEEAQVSANLICDWLIDATSVTPGNGSSDTLVIVHPEGDQEIQITVSYSASLGEVSYTAVNTANPSVVIGSGVLASNVTGVNFSSTFDQDRNVRISMDFEMNERTYHAVTDSTSRNHDFISTGGGSNGDAPQIGFDIPAVGGRYYVVLEPGQNDTHGASFNFRAMVYYSEPAQTELTITPSSGDTSMTITRQAGTCTWDVKTQCNDTALNGATFTFTASKTLPDGTILTDSEDVTVLIRRVTKCECSADEAALSFGTQGKAGSVYAPVTVDLGAQNADQIVAAAPYDAGLYQYKDPRSIKVFCMLWSDGGHGWVNVGNPSDSDRYVDYTVSVVGGVPQVQVSLRKNLTDKDLYVVVVADHSGTLSGDINNGNDHRAPVPTAFNKVTSLSGANFTYTDDPHSSPEAYYDYFIVKKGANGGINTDGAGFRRGSQAFLVASTSNFDTLNTNIQNNVSDYASCRYSVVLRFKGQTPPDNTEHMYVVSTYGYNELSAKYTNGEGFLMRNAESDIFRLDTAYDITVEIVAYNPSTHQQTVVASADSVIPASTPYIADPNNGYVFKTDTYGSKNNSLTLDSAKTLYVYYPGFDNEYSYVSDAGNTGATLKVEVWNDSNHDNVAQESEWVDFTAPEIQNKDAIKSPISEINNVVLSDGTTYYIGAYNEHNYPEVSVNLRKLYVSPNGLSSGSYYRISFEVVMYEYSNFSSGTIGGTEGTAGTPVATTYNLTGSDYGYIYLYKP